MRLEWKVMSSVMNFSSYLLFYSCSVSNDFIREKVFLGQCASRILAKPNLAPTPRNAAHSSWFCRLLPVLQLKWHRPVKPAGVQFVRNVHVPNFILKYSCMFSSQTTSVCSFIGLYCGYNISQSTQIWSCSQIRELSSCCCVSGQMPTLLLCQ